MEKLNFDQDYILENEVVQLRPLQKKDTDTLVQYALTEPTLWQYSLMPANGRENMEKYIAAALADKVSGKSYPFIVFDKRTQQYAGSTRFYDFSVTHHTTQLGYTWYGKDYWGTGLNKNCKYLMLQFAFDRLGLHRVEFRADNNNKRSIAAMKSIGCTVEGILRSNCASTNGRRDSIVLSILKDEWDMKVKTSLSEKCQRQ